MWLLYDPERDPSRVYYGTDTRAVTLLVGALLAFAWPAARLPARRSAPRAVALLDVVGAAGLVVVLLLFWRLRDYEPRVYRGGLELAALASILVVAAAAHPATRLGRVLGWSPLRWLGVRSYGIYLWHWPVLVFSRPGVDVPWRGPGLVAAQAAATVALAALSFRFVEEPIRHGRVLQQLASLLPSTGRRRRRISIAVAVAALAGVLALVLGVAAPSGHGTSANRRALDSLPAVAPVASPAPAVHAHAAAAHRPVHRPRPAAAPRGALLAIGDSVMLGCDRNLQERVGGRLQIDAVVGRQTIDAVHRLDLYRRRHALPDTVIVQVGDNGPAWYHDLVQLRDVLSGVRHVILVSVRVQRSWEGQVNSELAEFTSLWRRAVVADWYARSSDSLLEDGVHPTPYGCDVYARTVADAVRRAETGAPARRQAA
jgi:peptidoglycan/LPS O-acetylase OafA/YrhL